MNKKMGQLNLKGIFRALACTTLINPINGVVAATIEDQVREQFRQQNYEEVIDLVESSVSTLGADAEMSRVAGLSYYYLDRYDEALLRLENGSLAISEDSEVALALATVRFYKHNYVEAMRLINTVVSAEPDIMLRTTLLRARVLVADGEIDAAISILEKFDRSNPTIYQRAAQLLAQLHLARGDTRKASAVVKNALSLKPDSFEAGSLRYISSLTQNPLKPWEWSTTIGYRTEYDSNVTIGSDNPLIVGGTRQSDMRGTLLADATVVRRFTDVWTVFSEAHFYQNLHQDLSQYDETHVDFSISPVMTSGSIAYRFPIEISEKLERGKIFSTTIAALPGVSVTNSQRWSTHLFAHLKSLQFKIDVSPEENPDSRYGGVGFLVLAPFNNSVGNARLVAEYGRYDAEGSNWDRTSYSVLANLNYRPISKVSFDISAQYEQSIFGVLHSSELKMRDDNAIWISGKASYRITTNWNVFAQVAFVEQRSNIELYDYDRTVNAIGVSWTL